MSLQPDKLRTILSGGSMSFSLLCLLERTADPPDPPEGVAILWMSDGTDSGDDGDIMITITAGGTTKTTTVIDFSAV